MLESLFSPLWYRVESLKPRLRSHGNIQRHQYRKQIWYVFEDTLSGRNHRLTPVAHYLVGLMDGKRDMQSIWEAMTSHLGDDAPTQDEIIQLLAQLHAADVMQCNVTPDSRELFKRYRHKKQVHWKQRLLNPLALRFTLFDPDQFLERWMPLLRPLFSSFAAFLWLLVIAVATVYAGIHWSELSNNVIDRILSPQNLLILCLTYPVVKTLHEFGHAFAAKRWGGEVHEMGVMMLLFMPIPYVNTSCAAAFPEKHKRIIVGAAGMIVELFLAALALFVWLNVEAGIISSIAFNVMLIGGVSSLFFNGNPLLRYDGYYILADSIDIPNLASRAKVYLGYLLQRYIFGVKDIKTDVISTSERLWLVSYGITSFLYRFFLMLYIALFVAGKYFFVGVALAILVLINQLLLPVIKMFSFFIGDIKLQRQRSRVLITSIGSFAIVLVLTIAVPAPLWTMAEGVVWLPEQSRVRAGADGFILRYAVSPGSYVEVGDALIISEDPLLNIRVKVLLAEQRELQSRYNSLRSTDRVQSEIIKEKLIALKLGLAHARENENSLVTVSHAAGKFTVPQVQDLPGKFVRKGDLLGFIIDPDTIMARVAIPQDNIGLIRARNQGITIRLSGDISSSYAVMIKNTVPSATDQLPSKALGTMGGGPIAVDPSDEDGLRTLTKVFLMDLFMPVGINSNIVGRRVYIRFDHGSEPLVYRWYRSFRQLFLKHFQL